MTDSLTMTQSSVRPADGRAWYARPVRLLTLTLGLAMQAWFAIPGLVLGLFTLLAVPLGLLGIGFVLAWLVVPATRMFAQWQRRIAARALGEPVRGVYADTTGVNPFVRPLRWLHDRRRWQDVAWLAVAATIGALASLLPLVMLGAWIVYLVMACIFGWFWWLLFVFIGAPVAVLWWRFTPDIVRLKARFDALLLGTSRTAELAERVEAVTESRAGAIDLSSAEIRRIERDLHDGAQARIAALGMTIGLAEQQLPTDPDAVAALLREARETASSALSDLRAVVRGMHPPVLADRGLSGAIEALVLPIPLPVTLHWAVPDDLPPPARSAVYFAVAECLANAVKHSGAQRLWVEGAYADGHLRVVVGDDGRGGADRAGTGLAGVARRLDAFDGTMGLDSPVGGPTVITMEMRC